MQNYPRVTTFDEVLRNLDILSDEERRWIDKIEKLRQKLSQSREEISTTFVSDRDAARVNYRRGIDVCTVGKFCATASKKYRYAILLFKLIRTFGPSICIELGTGLGISAAYQAAALELNNHGHVVLLEGSPWLAFLAEKNLNELGLGKRVTVVSGRFRNTLRRVLKAYAPIPFAFIDGDHSRAALLYLFGEISAFLSPNGVCVVDDINLSEEMKGAWNWIRTNEGATSATLEYGIGKRCGMGIVCRTAIQYSVVIPTYNRAELLRKNLDALANQTVSHDEYEIIVVNDGSRDHTDAVAENFRKTKAEINFVYLKQKNCGVAAARNAGIRRARGEIVFFTDDDCVVPERWIETLADGYRRHPEVAGVGGLYEFPEDTCEKSVFARYHKFKMEHLWYGPGVLAQEIKNNIFAKNPAGNTSNMSYKKSALEEVGGFDEVFTSPGSDDTDLKKRIMDQGYTLLYLPYPVIHRHPINVLEIARRFFNFGRGRYLAASKNKEFFRSYDQSLARLDAILQKQPVGNTEFRCMAYLDFFLTQCGWEYQRFIQFFITKRSPPSVY